MLIDQTGLLYGERIGAVSDEAKLHFPRLLVASNGFGRIEMSYSKLIATVYAQFKIKPTKDLITRILHEYFENFLLFVYRADDGTVWGQWDVPAAMLPRYKREEDKRTPHPDPEQLAAYRASYIESRRAKYSSHEDIIDFRKISEDSQNISEDFGNVPRGFGNIDGFSAKSAKRFGTFPKVSAREERSGVGVGVGVGVGEERSGYCSEPSGSEPAIAHLPTNRKGEFFQVAQSMVDNWKRLYPAVDVDQQLRNIEGWLDGNPAKRKTLGGMKKFINTWLSDEQNKGGRASAGVAYGRGVGVGARQNPASARNEKSRASIGKVFDKFRSSAARDAHGANQEFVPGAGDSAGDAGNVGACVDGPVKFARNFGNEEGATASHAFVEVLPPTVGASRAPGGNTASAIDNLRSVHAP